MTTIVGISGSLRRASYNGALLRAAASLAPASVSIDVAGIADVPLYNGDVESEQGIPPAVSVLKEKVAAAQGLLLVTPEYNHSLPGVLKNAIDWLSRPGSDIARVFGGKPVGIIGASTGRLGTAHAQTAWLAVFRALGLVPYHGRTLFVAGAAKLFDASGKLTDADTEKRLREYVAGFAEFCAKA
jgi:chromate reductase, NAD(P)H dehydrogenase (quinone)